MKKKTLFILLSTVVLGLVACASDGDEPESKTSFPSSEVSTTSSNTSGTSSNTSQSSSSQSSSSKPGVTYSITYNLDGGSNSFNNPTTYTAGTTFTFEPATKLGYTFTGWYDSKSNKVTQIKSTTTGNLVLTAHYNANKNTLTVTSEDVNKGTAKITSGSGYSNESITVSASPTLLYKFTGWYNGSNKVSSNATYTFTMPRNDYVLEARFDYDETKAVKYGLVPSLSQDGKTLTYGLYPQKNVNNSSLVTALNKLSKKEANGYYLYNNEYYAKVVATPNKSSYKFDNGVTIVDGTTYWFKCEAIGWNVLSKAGSDYYLASSLILDNQCYYHSQDSRVIDAHTVYANNYEYSDIRKWLNDEFYTAAFTLEDSYVQETFVDNSGSTTHYDYNEYACDNTLDKVYLPSYQDYINTSYGFVNDTGTSETRKCKTTDWARARGAYYNTKVNLYYSSYWTRSPRNYSDSKYNSWVVGSFGEVGFDGATEEDGIRPAINIKIS